MHIWRFRALQRRVLWVAVKVCLMGRPWSVTAKANIQISPHTPPPHFHCSVIVLTAAGRWGRSQNASGWVVVTLTAGFNSENGPVPQGQCECLTFFCNN